MSNVQYEDKMFDEEKKQEFMGDYSIGTVKIYQRIFRLSQTVEHDLNKDLHDFNREELRQMFFMFKPKTAASSKGNVSYVSKYIDWAIEQGLRKGLNPLSLINTTWKEQFVNTSIKQFWTDKEIHKIVSKLTNCQDAILVVLPFSGARGKENNEILNLRKKDVNTAKNTLLLRDDDTERTIEVAPVVITLCEGAIKEHEYIKMNGNPSVDIKNPVAQLIDTDYVVRVANTNTLESDKADKSVVHRRLAKIAEEMGEPHLTPLNLCNSGMIAMAHRLLQETGKLGEEEYEKVFVQFGEKSEMVKQRIRTDFLNEAKIKELYGVS